MQTTVLLTLGRLPAALEIARAFARQDYRVIIAEPFAWPLCRLSKYVDRCFKTTAPVHEVDAYCDQMLAIINAEQVSIVIPVSEEIIFVSALKARLPGTVTLACMDQKTLTMLHDKYRFATWATAQSLPMPETALASDVEKAQDVGASAHIVKPRLSCSGVGVRSAEAGKPLLPTEMTSKYIVQHRLNGDHCSSFSIAAGGSVITSICYQGLLQSGTVSVCFKQIQMPPEIEAFITTAVSSLKFNGMISFDFIQSATGEWQAIECNPRATSGIHFVEPKVLVQALLTVANQAAPPAVDTEANDNDKLCRSPRMEFWSCLTRVEGDLFKLKWNRDGWRLLFTARDVTWSRIDSKPCLLMPLVLAPQLWQAIRQRRPVSELLLLDVGWYSE